MMFGLKPVLGKFTDMLGLFDDPENAKSTVPKMIWNPNAVVMIWDGVLCQAQSVALEVDKLSSKKQPWTIHTIRLSVLPMNV